MNCTKSKIVQLLFYTKSRIDVRTTLSDGTEVNVEMQMRSSGYSDKRCLQLWSKLYSNTLEAGSDYNSLRKTICIWILNENEFPETKDFQTKWKITAQNYLAENRFNDLEFHIIELQKLRDHGIINLTNKNFWLWFIDHSDGELINMACKNNDKIREAREQLDKLRADKELMERIRLEETYEMDVRTLLNNAKNDGLEAGKTEGEAIGLEKGRNEAKALLNNSKKEIALNLLKLNLPIEQISQATGLSADEIKKLKN